MNHFRPKEVLHRAREAEKAGDLRSAANDYALLSMFFRRKARFSDAKKMIEQAIKLIPESGRLYLEKSLCELSLGNLEEAKTWVQRCARLGIEKKRIKTYFGYLEKDLSDVPQLREKFFYEWLSLDRTTLTPFIGLGRALNAQKKWGEGKLALLDALTIDAKNAELIELMTQTLEKLNIRTEIEYWEQFLKGDIDVKAVSVLLGKRAEGERASQKAEERKEDLKDLSELVDELEKELELDSDEKFENIEPLMMEFRRKSHQIIGSDAQARLDLAHAFSEMGRYREAKEELCQIDMSNPLYGQAQYHLGNVLKTEGSDVAALGAFQTVLRVSSEQTSLWKEAVYQLARLYCRLGDNPKAIEMVQLLEKKDGDYRTLKTLKQHLGLSKKDK